MDIFNLIQSNLLTPIILFFLFGIIAARIKSDLKIPEAISEFLPIYLLAAIGLHGGIEMRKTGFEEMLIPMLVAIGLSLLFTLNHYQILKRLGKFNIFDSYALASTYGAVGAVTFSVGLSFLKNQGVTSEGYLAAILAVLEPVAFIMAIFLTNMAVSKQIRSKKQSFSKDDASDIDIGMKETKTKLSQVLQESITGKAIVILLGSIVIGYIIGEEGFEPISIVFDELFTGAIVIFMIEMGIIAGQRLEDIKKVGMLLTAFAIIILYIVFSWILKNRRDMKELEEMTERAIKDKLYISGKPNEDKIKKEIPVIKEEILAREEKYIGIEEDNPEGEILDDKEENEDEEILDDFERRLKRIRRDE